MPPKDEPKFDRAADLAKAIRSSTTQHISDVRGATGCYYCWIGDPGKCTEACAKVHKVYTQGTRQFAVDEFDRVTPYLTQLHKQSTSIFDETKAARDIILRRAEQLDKFDTLQNDVLRGHERMVQSSSSVERKRRGGWESFAMDLQATELYDARSAAARRHPELKSIHKPERVEAAYKYPRGSVIVPVTPYTCVSVAPNTHAYGAHNRAELRSGDAIWTGRLVKEGTVAQDPRSIAVAERIKYGRAMTPPPSQRNNTRSESRSTSVMSSSGTRIRQVTGGGQRVRVRQDHNASFVLSGGFQSALDMPMPEIFNLIPQP